MSAVSFCDFWSEGPDFDRCKHCGEPHKKHSNGMPAEESYIPGLSFGELDLLDRLRDLEKRSDIQANLTSLYRKGFVKSDVRINRTTRDGKKVINLANRG